MPDLWAQALAWITGSRTILGHEGRGFIHSFQPCTSTRVIFPNLLGRPYFVCLWKPKVRSFLAIRPSVLRNHEWKSAKVIDKGYDKPKLLVSIHMHDTNHIAICERMKVVVISHLQPVIRPRSAESWELRAVMLRILGSLSRFWGFGFSGRSGRASIFNADKQGPRLLAPSFCRFLSGASKKTKEDAPNNNPQQNKQQHRPAHYPN